MTTFEKVHADDIELRQTCGACPEQYDAYVGSEMVGYLRLRHGFFRVECPDIGGEMVDSGYPQGDGCFDVDEREDYLDHAKMAIATWVNTQRSVENALEAYCESDVRVTIQHENARLRAENARLLADNERLERALDSVASYAWRPDPPNAHKPFTSAERLSSIRFHPEIKKRIKEASGD